MPQHTTENLPPGSPTPSGTATADPAAASSTSSTGNTRAASASSAFTPTGGDWFESPYGKNSSSKYGSAANGSRALSGDASRFALGALTDEEMKIMRDKANGAGSSGAGSSGVGRAGSMGQAGMPGVGGAGAAGGRSRNDEEREHHPADYLISIDNGNKLIGPLPGSFDPSSESGMTKKPTRNKSAQRGTLGVDHFYERYVHGF